MYLGCVLVVLFVLFILQNINLFIGQCNHSQQQAENNTKGKILGGEYKNKYISV